jgi:hypothetical protein
MRFTGVTIPKGASIVNAWVQFRVDETGSSATSVSIQGQAVDNAATFTTSASNVTSRPRTVASVNWAPGAWTAVGDAGAAQRTPNLASVIQEIVGRSGWVSGNSLVLIITGTGTRTAESFEGSQTAAPLLHVEYGGNQPPSVSAGTDQTITFPASANLNGTVSDDGKPGPLTTTWSKLSGPGTVTFGNASAVDTTASFSAAGSYTLRLTANDGAVSVFDDVAITVAAAGQGTLSVIKKGVIHDATDATAYSFASTTASNNRLYVVFVNTSIGTGTAPWATSISGAGLTFTELGTPGGASYSSSTGVRRVQAWRALVSAGATTGAIRISLSGTSTGMDAVLLEFGGVNTSGTNGAGAIAQNVFRKVTGATSLSMALSPLASPGNRPVAFFTHRAAEATTQASGYTELDDASHGSPVTGVECQWHASSANNAPSASWSTSADGAGVALEIKAAP